MTICEGPVSLLQPSFFTEDRRSRSNWQEIAINSHFRCLFLLLFFIIFYFNWRIAVRIAPNYGQQDRSVEVLVLLLSTIFTSEYRLLRLWSTPSPLSTPPIRGKIKSSLIYTRTCTHTRARLRGLMFNYLCTDTRVPFTVILRQVSWDNDIEIPWCSFHYSWMYSK
jgi:hypothetical protein